MVKQEWEWDWPENGSVHEPYEFSQDDLLGNINFDDTTLGQTPFDETLTVPELGDFSVKVEESGETNVGGQGLLDFQFDNMSFAPETGVEHLLLAPVDQAPAAGFIDPQFLLNTDALGDNGFPELGGDFATFNVDFDVDEVLPPVTTTYGNNLLTFPAPPPPQPESTSRHGKPSRRSHRRSSIASSSKSSTGKGRRHSSSGMSGYSTPQEQHTTNHRRKRKLSSRPPSPRIDRSQTVAARRPELSYNGRPLKLRSDKIPRHTRQKKERPEPRQWYVPLHEKPPSWGPPDVRGEPIFRYTEFGELEPGRFYDLSEMRQYLLGPKHSERFPMPALHEGVPKVKGKKRQGLTLWIGLPGSECNWRYPRMGDSTKCRFSECLHDNHTIRQGEFWVIFDEHMNETGDVINPFHNAGYVHLDCLERFFDLVELWQTVDVRIDDRDFKYEEYGYFKLGRKHPRIVDEVAKWWKDEYQKWCDYREGGPKRSREFEFSLVRRLVEFDLEHEPRARKRTRLVRQGNDFSRHRGDVKEQKRWRTLRDFGLLDKNGVPFPDADERLEEYLGEASKEKSERRKARAMQKRWRMTGTTSFDDFPSPLSDPVNTSRAEPRLGDNHQAGPSSFYSAAPSLPHAAAYTSVGGLSFPAMQQPVYTQYPATAGQTGVPMPFFQPHGLLIPMPEEPPRKRNRDETESDDDGVVSAPKRQRKEPPQPKAAPPAHTITTAMLINPTADAEFGLTMPPLFTPAGFFEEGAETAGWAGPLDGESNLDAVFEREIDGFYTGEHSFGGNGEPNPPGANNGAGNSEVDTSCIGPALLDNANPDTPEVDDSLFGGSNFSEVDDSPLDSDMSEYSDDSDDEN
ncbi:hypothetical protein F4809DRAFT_644567 [Biscogniauxia mediterranea]|nr:hypothetical protein F4809DRAFT_644567 [Biscogniauxia mediterranea]